MQRYFRQLRHMTTGLKGLMRAYYDEWKKKRPTCRHVSLIFRNGKDINMIWNGVVKETLVKKQESPSYKTLQ